MEALNHHIKVLSSRHGGSAEIRLNPPELGPLKISLDISAGHTRISILAHTDAARHLIDQQVPQLKALLGDAVNVDVQQHGHGQSTGAGLFNGGDDAQRESRLDSGSLGGDDRDANHIVAEAGIDLVGFRPSPGLINLYA